MSRLTFLERAQWWERARIEESRTESLRALVRLVYSEVPLYRRLYDGAGVRPEDVSSIGDLRRLPVVTKYRLRAGYPEQCCRDTGTSVYGASTSGSTGTNFHVREDLPTAGRYRACFMLALGWAGWRIGDPHLQTGMTLERSLDRRLKDWLLRCHYISAFDLTDTHLDATLEVLEQRGIEHLWGYPGSLLCLARRAAQRGWNRALRSTVTWGDALHAAHRAQIEAAFGARVTDTYGCGEGIQVAAQCGAGPWYHVHALDTIVEYVDNDGQPVPEGVPGKILLTRLYPGPMPFVRYEVGDIGVGMGGARCSCGRGFELMASVVGRTADMVVTPSGNRLIVHFFTGILEHFSEIDSFQVVQDEPDRIVLRLLPARPDSCDEDTRQAVVGALRAKGADLRVDIEVVKQIPLSRGGKQRFVISTIGESQGEPH